MKILIELPTWLGDSVMATPAIENLINYYKNSQVVLIGSSVSVEIFKNHPNVSEIHILNKKYLSLFKIAKKLGKFDTFLSFRGSIRSVFFKLFISSEYKYQYKQSNFKNGHQVEKYNNFINKSLNTEFSPGHLIIYPDDSLTKKPYSLNKLKPMLGINPGATYSESKRWHPEKFAKVATELSNKFDILIFGGPNEKEIAGDIEKALIEKGVINYQNLAAKTSVEELIYHISTLDLFVSGDSGPIHIAAAFQVPTVTIFGPTKDKETSQWMNLKNTIVKKGLDCQPCMKRNCPLKHNNCMKLIKPEEVLNAVKSLN